MKHTGYNSDAFMYAKDGSLLRIRPVPPLFITSYDYKYNGKEYQDELALNVYDYGARNYDPSLGRWMNMDEKSEKFTSFSPYNYCVNNPVRIIDPDGKAPSDIIGLFNKSTGQLTVIDKDHYDAKLPTIYVNSSQYKMGGIRDDKGNLTTNQVLVLDNFFTGGESENGNVTRDPDRPQQKPIPNGIFDVLDNDADTKHEGWFRLDRVDKERFNDKDDATGRSGFRLHLGTESWGCITGDKSKDSRTKDWSVLTEILNTTSTTLVPKKRGNQKWNPFSFLINYGKINVVGEDKIPVQKEEKK